MGIIVQHELLCDLCGARYQPTWEHVPNAGGRTKLGQATRELREEARRLGWSRPVSREHGGRKVDVCPECKDRRPV